MTSNGIVQKLWNYCNVLRDDGLSYGDYVEQLTFLLFLKMADEQTRPPFSKPSTIPKAYAWPSLLAKDGDELEIHYRHMLESLGKEKGMLGVIFRKAQNKIQDPAKLRRLIADLIDKEQWTSLEADVKGDAYEGLLEKNAADVKGGAGQYFTPRALISAIVDVMRPAPGQTIHDPACGTGGFLLVAHDYVSRQYPLDRDQKKHLKLKALSGNELVDSVARLCVMNLYLHGIGGDDCPIEGGADSLAEKPSVAYEMVLTNPPFGKKSSITVMNEEGEESKEALTYVRDDFWATTSNKQLNFLQQWRTRAVHRSAPPNAARRVKPSAPPAILSLPSSIHACSETSPPSRATPRHSRLARPRRRSMACAASARGRPTTFMASRAARRSIAQATQRASSAAKRRMRRGGRSAQANRRAGDTKRTASRARASVTAASRR